MEARIFLLGILVVLAYSLEPLKIKGNNIADLNPENLQSWQKFKSNYIPRGKLRSSITSQETYRLSVLQDNLIAINKNNNQNKGWKEGVNKFTFFTRDQFKGKILGLIPKVFTPSVEKTAQRLLATKTKSAFNFPVTIDWQLKQMVSPVQEQGLCGACWSFTVTASIQSLLLIRKTPQSLSQQQLIDCTSSQPYENYGCFGGDYPDAFQYVKENGLTTQNLYPFKGKNSQCKVKPHQTGLKIKQYVKLKNSCIQITMALVKQPVAVAVDSTDWANYKSGIMRGECTQMNHAVLLVGQTKDSWKIKNSWGVDWGEKGFMRISAGNTYCVCQHGFYPVL